MDRRKAMKLTAGAIIGSGAGILTFTKASKPEYLPVEESKKPVYKNDDSAWPYYPLDPSVSADLVYKYYDGGSCMYAICKSVLSQLADKFGEPYASFPVHMMKYGHGGVGGFGTICGALNGAAALIGLFVTDKTEQDRLITGILRWHEKVELPEYRPQKAILNFIPPPTVANSILCHVSNNAWVTETGFKLNSNERKERCRRLTCDVASRVTVSLNEFFCNDYVTDNHDK